jgi:hypothetical protein
MWWLVLVFEETEENVQGWLPTAMTYSFDPAVVKVGSARNPSN